MNFWETPFPEKKKVNPKYSSHGYYEYSGYGKQTNIPDWGDWSELDDLFG